MHSIMLFYTFGSFFVYQLVHANLPPIGHKRIEYKYSFKPPYLAQKNGSIPFWEYGGNAIAGGELVRLAQSLKSQKGAIWSKFHVGMENITWWQVEIHFKIFGKARIGADGMAFWYTRNRGSVTGDVFGSSDFWDGLGLMFDSFDNDNKHNNPAIYAIINDGTKQFNHKNDGEDQKIGACQNRDYRNKKFYSGARITYYLNTLTVDVRLGIDKDEPFEPCFVANNVVLPPNGYFGLSAATGDLADDHDVFAFITHSLHVMPPVKAQEGSPEDLAKMREYEQYQQKTEKHKEEYRKEHPDEADKDEEEWFEGDGQRELRQIYESLSHVYEVARELARKVDEMLGKQNNAMSMLSAVYSTTQGGAPPQAAQAHPQVAGGAIPAVGRHEWEVLVGNNQLIINTISELKGFIVELARKADAAGGAGPGGAVLAEVRDALHQLKQAAQHQPRVAGAVPPSHECPPASCATTTTLAMLLLGHLVLLLGYFVYKERKEAQAKKFF